MGEGRQPTITPHYTHMYNCSLAQTVLCGVVAPCYQCGGIDNKVPQLQVTQSAFTLRLV